uniref:Uncharacterized protein n=1 Tax=Ananas comosus var. bracteatus TaxID=296719 RepID=A0A6V7PF64_ANACO|nr:unnamed protein product [Ananas comosus var. bracteatus]
MAIERKEAVLYIGKVLRFSVRLSYRSVCDHPIFFCIGFLLLLLYRSFPSLFYFLLSSSPVIVCTTLLLGVLLSCGESRIPEIEEEKEQDYKYDEKTSSLKVGTSNNNTDEIFTEQTYTESTAKVTYLSEERANKEFGIEGKVDEERGHCDQGIGEKRELSEENPVEEAARVGEDVGCSSSVNGNPAEGPNIDGRYSFLDSEPDLPLSSYPNPSMVDLTLMHDQKPKADEGGGEGKEEDQKSVMDLGPCVLERYRRLESLIARRRARKNLRFELEKNLIDLDVNGSASSVDEFSRFHAQIPPISAPRPNPLDLFNDSEETSAVPGSAPSILHQRKSPFDLSPFDQVSESSGISSLLRENWYPREFMSISQRDMLFRRHDSFNLSGGELRQEKRFSRLRPYYASDTIDLDLGSSSTTFHRQLSDKSESKLSFVLELDDIVSSVNDQDYCENTIEKHDEETLEDGSQCSDGGESMEVEVENSEISATDGDVSRLNDVVLFGSLEEKEDSEEVSSSLTILDAEKFKLMEEKQGGLTSHTLSEDTEKKPIPDLISWEGTGESQILHNTGEGSVGADSSLVAEAKLNLSRVVSFPMLVEEKVVSERGGEMPASDETNLVNLFSVSSTKESESRSKATEENDLIGIKSPTVHQASVNLAASEISEGGKAREDNLIDLNSYPESLLLNGLNSYAPELVQPSTQNYLMQPSFQPDLGDSYISIMDLHPIPEVDFSMISEETLKVLKLQKEQGNLTLPDSVVGSTELDITGEQNIVYSDIERDLTHKFEEGSPSDNAPTIHIHDGGSVQLQLLDSIESLNKPSSSPMDSDFLSKPDTVSTESRKNIASTVQTKREISPENYLYDSEEECDQIYPEFIGIDDIDEDLLSELDAVGDFHVEELMPGRRFNRMATDFSNTEIHEIPAELQNSQASLNLSRNFPSRSTEVVGTLFGPSSGDPEQTVYNPRFRILDSSSAEEINSLLKQLQEEEERAKVSFVPVASIETSSTINKEADSSELGSTESEPKLIENDSDMVVLEAKSIEDIDSAIKQFNEILDKSSISEFGSFEVVQGETNFGPTVVDSDIQVIEAKSLDDINVALEQFSEGLDKSLISEVESSEVVQGERDFGPTVVDSDTQVIEAKSLDDINVALQQFSEGLDKPLSLEVASSDVIERERHFFEAMTIISDIQVIEAKSLDDIAVAWKQFSEDPEKSTIPDIGGSQLIPGVMDIEPIETNSDIQVIEAKSLDDIDVVLKQFSEGLEKSLISEVGTLEFTQGEIDFGPTMINSDILVVEARSLDDIDVALKHFSGSVNDSNSEAHEK